MLDSLVPVAFWSVFSLLAFGAAIFLLGTILASTQLSTARHHVDDGSDDPGSASYRLYALSMRSHQLSIAASLAFMPLVVAAIAAFAGSTALMSFAALGFAGLTLVVADAVRMRHDRVEKDFERLAGMPIREIYARVINRQPALLQAQDDRSASI